MAKKFKTVIGPPRSPYCIGVSGQNPTFIPDFLDAATCRAVRSAMDGGAIDPAEILADGIALDEQARRALSIEVDSETLAAIERRFDVARPWLSARAEAQLTGREGAGFIRYSHGGFYGPHHDQGQDCQWPDAARRRLAVVVFLNHEGFIGGELVIYNGARRGEQCDPIAITPRQGLLVAFDARRLHEVRPVQGGIRDVIVDWFY
jgi:predicted 2-oxoglutarate/Fe(II)-dependent dioxygenase YbiX